MTGRTISFEVSLRKESQGKVSYILALLPNFSWFFVLKHAGLLFQESCRSMKRHLIFFSIFTGLFLSCLTLSAQGGFFSVNGISSHLAPLSSFMRLAANRIKGSGKSSSAFVSNIRFHDHKTYTRIVLDLSRQRTVSESRNSRDHQVTFQFKKIRLAKKAKTRLAFKDFPQGIELSEVADHNLALTLDLGSIEKYKYQTLRKPDRFVIDVFYFPPSTKPVREAANQPGRSPVNSQIPGSLGQKPESRGVQPVNQPESESPINNSPSDVIDQPPVPTALAIPGRAKSFKEVLVVVDPGHGGKDPGAIGARGTQEKDVTLQIAKELQHLMQRRLGSKVLLTRTSDVFLDLEDRVAFANTQKADVFISIHVNSHSMKSIKGLEVYHFGKASDPRALQVAARENGLSLEENAPTWQFIIADKLNDQKIEESQNFAWTTRETLLKSLTKNYAVKDHGVKTAPFYVLRFTTMPSILTEVAFVSNPTEEKWLRSPTYQKNLAEGIYEGIHHYLASLYPGIS